MKTRYRQMLIDQKVHDEISAAKRIFHEMSGKRLSSREIIDEFLGRRLRFMSLCNEVRSYINAFVAGAVLNRRVLGLVLFGSVARNNFGKYSDIDVLVVVDGRAMDSFDEVNSIISRAEPYRKPLISLGLHNRISPLVLPAADLKSFRPIYIDFLEEGVVLFEKNDTILNFMNDIRRSVEYEKRTVNGVVMIEWRIKR